MEIRELQKEIENVYEKIQKIKGKRFNKYNLFMHLIEEIGEISKELLKEDYSFESFSKEKLQEEIIDATVNLFYLSSKYGIDMEKALIEQKRKLGYL